MITDAKDVELFSLLALQPALSEAALVRLKQRWEARRLPNESLANWLVREEMLAPEAPRTLELVRRGFQSFPEATILFRHGGWERLLALVDAGAAEDTPVERRPTPRPPPAAPTDSAKLNSPARSSSIVPSLWTVGLEGDLFTSSDDAQIQRTPRMEPKTHPIAGAHAAAHVNELQLGSTLGKCMLTEVIGKGGYGTVYRALHLGLNITVAVKVLNRSALARDIAVFERLQHEAKLLAQLNHPNIIRVFDFEVAPLPYVVLEHVEGLSIADLIQQCGGLRLRRSTDLMIQTAEALAAAWKVGIVHRDVKPANILVTRDSTAKLADLGLAVAVGAPGGPFAGTAVEASVPAGTVAYMSPEQIRGDADLDCRSDIYSLGATFYHAATGVLPFPGKTCVEVVRKHLTEKPTPPMRHMPNLHPLAAKIILRMLEKRPEERYASYAELLQELRRLAARIEGSSFAGHADAKRMPDEERLEPPTSGFWRLVGALLGKKSPPAEQNGK